MIEKKRLLVTGASGFLGWNVCRIALSDYSVIGVYNARTIALPGIQPEKCDITDFRALRELFLRIKPDALIHTAAESRPDVCQEHPEITKKINVDSSLAIAGLCSDLQIPCAFTSSDLVFDGVFPPFREECALSPASVYGEQKAAAETGMRSRHGRVVICRMPLMYGDVPPQAFSFIQPQISSILAGKEIRLFFDAFRTPVSGSSAARGLLLALSHTPDILHLGGRERISRYDFGVKLARALGRPDTPLTAVSQKDVVLGAPRPLDVSLDSTKAMALGYNPLPVDVELAMLDCVKKAFGRSLGAPEGVSTCSIPDTRR
jgi:dTDP-4-dehydrorhamnose reductase